MLSTLIAGLLVVAPLLSDSYGGHLEALVERAWPDSEAPVDPALPGSLAGFELVVASDAFLHEAVGPFDVYILLEDGLAKQSKARKTLGLITKSLRSTVPVMEQHFGGSDETALIAGRRLPILVADSDRGSGEHGFDELVALIDWAEDDWTSWKPDRNPIWTSELRAGLNVRTWAVQAFNLGHDFAQEQGKAFLNHGLGYYTLAHVTARVLRQGAWGLVPPWLSQGITDELDIQAFGEAWVGGDQWSSQQPGWFRPGWAGFVPQGQLPPAPVTGPPHRLAVTVSRVGDSWQHRDFSAERHWKHLLKDRKSEAPASFLFMAVHESFLPRDRALARATMHLLLHAAPPQDRPNLLTALDRVPTQRSNGMFDSEPLPKVVSDTLGGLAEVDQLESLTLGEMLSAIDQEGIADKLKQLGAEKLFAISDHRDQCQWLYRKSMPASKRQEIWNLILEAEYYQQLVEWQMVGAALDSAVDATLASSRKFPKRERDIQKAAGAFWESLEGASR